MLTCQPQPISLSELNRTTQDIYDTLKKLANQKLICHQTLDTLVVKSGYSRSTIQRVLKELQQRHYISVEHYFDKRGRTLVNSYHLLMGSPT
jgi:hypothetical protein